MSAALRAPEVTKWLELLRAHFDALQTALVALDKHQEGASISPDEFHAALGKARRELHP